MRRVLIIALLLPAACGEERIVLRPVIDLPAASSDAYPIDVVDTLRLSIAHEGEEGDIASATGPPDDPPRLDNIPFDEDLVLHLSGVGSGADVAYGRSCSFSVPADNLEPHIYFSRVVKWAEGKDPGGVNRGRSGGHALPFGCGAVFLGGDNPDTDVQLFDPTSGDFQQLQVDLEPRTGTVVAPLPDGRVVISGGIDAGDQVVNLVEVVDLAAAVVEGYDGPAVAEHAAVVLQDGSVLVTGGRTETEASAAVWEFTLDDKGQFNDPSNLQDTPMLYARARHTMTRLSDELGAGVLIVGGRDSGDNPVPVAELYRPLQQEFREIVVSAPEVAAELPRYDHRAILMPGGFVLIIGGRRGSERVRSLVIYDTVDGQFRLAGNLPSDAGLTEMSVTRLPDDRILIAGGRDESGGRVAAVFIARLDPIDGRVTVVATDAMEVARAGHTAALLGDGTVLVVGGNDVDARAERYNPPNTGRR